MILIILSPGMIILTMIMIIPIVLSMIMIIPVFLSMISKQPCGPTVAWSECRIVGCEPSLYGIHACICIFNCNVFLLLNLLDFYFTFDLDLYCICRIVGCELSQCGIHACICIFNCKVFLFFDIAGFLFHILFGFVLDTYFDAQVGWQLTRDLYLYYYLQDFSGRYTLEGCQPMSTYDSYLDTVVGCLPMSNFLWALLMPTLIYWWVVNQRGICVLVFFLLFLELLGLWFLHRYICRLSTSEGWEKRKRKVSLPATWIPAEEEHRQLARVAKCKLFTQITIHTIHITGHMNPRGPTIATEEPTQSCET